MVELIEIKKENSKVQNGLTQTIEKNNKVSYSTKSRMGQIALIQK